ncbi:hypothetical protein [Kribbella sp. NPDC055071]
MRSARSLVAVVLAAVLVSTSAPAEATRHHPPTATVVSLGTPLSDVLLIGGTVAPGPNGKTAIWNVSTGTPAYLSAIDPVTGASLLSQALPGADGSYAVAATPDGTIYVGTYNNGHLYRLRPGGTVEDLGRPIATESFIWRITTDDQGNVYGGTFPNGKVFRYDDKTGAVRDYGQVRAGQPYVKSLDYANGKIYTGSLPDAHVMELDVTSGAITELPSPPGLDPTGKTVYDLNTRGGRVYVRIGTSAPGPLYVWDIASRTWVDDIPNTHGLDISPIGADGSLYLIQSSELKRYDPTTKTLTGTGLTFTGRIQNARAIGYADLGLPDYPGTSVVGTLWRGDEFRYNPQTGKSEIFPTQVRREPIEILSVAGGKDKIYAGGFLNGGVAVVDPNTGAATFNRFSQVEALMEASNGMVWVGAYPEARLYGYDPTKPWSSPEYSPGPPGTPDNPVQALNLKPDLFQTRARALVEVDGKIAVGTVPDGDRLGGALVIYDPKTGVAQKYRNVVQDESVFGLTARRGIVYGGTSIAGGLTTTPPTRTAGTVFAWDVKRSRKLWETVPVPGAATVSSVTIGPDGLVWGVAGKTVVAMDPGCGKVVKSFTLGTTTSSGDIVATREAVYVSIDQNKIYRIGPGRGDVPTLFVAHPHRRLGVRGDHQLLFSSGSTLFRVDISR